VEGEEADGGHRGPNRRTLAQFSKFGKENKRLSPLRAKTRIVEGNRFSEQTRGSGVAESFGEGNQEYGRLSFKRSSLDWLSSFYLSLVATGLYLLALTLHRSERRKLCSFNRWFNFTNYSSLLCSSYNVSELSHFAKF